jgi:hypothetical protein
MARFNGKTLEIAEWDMEHAGMRRKVARLEKVDCFFIPRKQFGDASWLRPA